MSTSLNTSTGDKPADPYKAKSAEDPPLPQKIEDLSNFISSAKFGMLTTKLADNDESLVSRCMALAGQENGGIDLIFHTNLFSHKTMDLVAHPREVNMSFLDASSGSWASISGSAQIVADAEVVQKFYSPALVAWLGDLGDGVHDGSPKDPRIGVIKLQATFVTYNVPKKGFVGRVVDEAKGAAKGDVPAFNSLREVTKEELEEWRRTHKE